MNQGEQAEKGQAVQNNVIDDLEYNWIFHNALILKDPVIGKFVSQPVGYDNQGT